MALISPALLGRQTALFLRLCTLPLIGEMILKPNDKTFARYIRACKNPDATFPEDWLEARREMVHVPGARSGMLAQLRAGMTFMGVRRRVLEETVRNLQEITLRTLLVYGEEDAFVPSRYVVEAGRKLPNARLLQIPKAGHCLTLERGAEISSILRSFFNDVEEPKGGH